MDALIPASDRISFLFAEKGYLEVDGHSLVLRQGEYLIHMPAGATSVIFIEPGTVVTHAAVRLCSGCGCLLVWVGESGVRLYAAGIQWANSSKKILEQAQVRLDPAQSFDAAKRIFTLMFDKAPNACRTVNQLRGMEGAMVKDIYQHLAKEYSIVWRGRSKETALSDPLNRAISAANAALYGIVEAVLLSIGYSPAIGFVHNGDRRSFVFDIADTVKFKTVVPLAMKKIADGTVKNESDIRHACRDLFRGRKLIETLINNAEYVVNGTNYGSTNHNLH